ncbi:hypothetical protein Q5424_15760 [Conexibacter sp. JD483]|uniref:hypothetical protein n=1 Tax=unclassified Conexibacter TaxID=2627773 RepID=UPI002715E1DE|nr:MULTISPECIES: hypothetical protein [unclassified Conexibacter]MDO8186431.1 hypothetical protein [Conexibacter sp. CPCC 205706]MDO8200000.1 hypothetical protein [Conexibacter sp. CPCC 205762]MDR9370553.1 hypothetical protein [Conexibacter sp. JD483]
MSAAAAPTPGELPGFDAALARIAAGADERERAAVPPFPADAFALLRDCGALAVNATVGPERPAAAQELRLVRAVAAADGSVGRIFDGHLNAVERLAVHGEGALRERELALVAGGRLLAGVWGGEPLPGEGPPAQLMPARAGDAADGIVARLRGVRTFCSGAGGLQRALVLAREQDDPAGPPVAAWVDLTRPGEVEVDERWFRGAGMRASVSHRVVFHDTAVLARFGGPGELALQPWFGRDALRTAASWAGIADTAAVAALEQLAARTRRGELEALAAGQLLAARQTIELWVDAAAAAMERGAPDELARLSALGRHAIAAAARELLEVAARACGSRPFASGGALDRARRDLELFLLQHRLDPIVARAGAVALDTLETL